MSASKSVPPPPVSSSDRAGTSGVRGRRGSLAAGSLCTGYGGLELKMFGNGVVTAQAAAALAVLLERTVAA